MGRFNLRGYGVHLFSSLAIVSLSIHIIYQRNLADTQRAQIDAQTSIMQNILRDLRSGKRLSKAEIEKQLKLAKRTNSLAEAVDMSVGETSWKEAFFGKKR